MPKSKQPPAVLTIREMREAAGFASVEAVAEHPDGVDARTMEKAEAGKPGLTVRTLGKIAKLVRRPLPEVASAYFAALQRVA